MTYTDGPWIVFDAQNGLFDVLPAMRIGSIALDIPNADDARLIAAAPDLLEACASVWLMLSDTKDNELRLIADECRAALEKAMGSTACVMAKHT